MATSATNYLGECYYNFTSGGNGSQDRKILFSRTSSSPESIQAEVFACGPLALVGGKIATIPGNSITLELENTTQQVNRLYARKFLSPFDYERGYGSSPLDRRLSDCSIEEQVVFIKSLTDGTRKIAPIIDGSTGNHEKVISLRLFDPS